MKIIVCDRERLTSIGILGRLRINANGTEPSVKHVTGVIWLTIDISPLVVARHIALDLALRTRLRRKVRDDSLAQIEMSRLFCENEGITRGNR